MKTNTDLHVEQNKLIQQHSLGTNCLRSLSGEKHWVPCEHRLPSSQQNLPAERKGNHTLGKSIPAAQENTMPFCLVLLRPRKKQCPVLDRVGQGQQTTMKTIRGLENIKDEERLKEMGFCSWRRAD